MGKLSTPKKTRSIKRILISILYHDLGIDLIKLLDKIKINKNDDLLIIFDNINDYSLNQLLKKKYKNIKLFFGSRKVKKVPYYRNIALKKAIPNYEILLFLDSDVLPCKNIVTVESFSFSSRIICLILSSLFLSDISGSCLVFWGFV